MEHKDQGINKGDAGPHPQLSDATLKPGAPNWFSIVENLFTKAGVLRIVPGSKGAEELHGATPEPILKSAVQFLGDRKPSIIVDAGSAQGESTLYLSKCFPDSRVYGIDSNADMIRDSRTVLRVAEQEGVVQPNRINFVEADLVSGCNILLGSAETIFFFAQSMQEVKNFAGTLAIWVKPKVPVLEVGFQSQLRQSLAAASSLAGRRFHEKSDPCNRVVRYFEMS